MNKTKALVEWYWQAETAVLREKPVQVPLYVSQTPYKMAGIEPGPL